jgi:hypothetical protein
MARIVALVEVDADHKAFRAGQIQDGVGLGKRKRQRLLDEDVRAVLERVEDRSRVEVIGRGDAEKVDLVAREDLFPRLFAEIRLRRGAGQPLGVPLDEPDGARFRPRADRHELPAHLGERPRGRVKPDAAEIRGDAASLEVLDRPEHHIPSKHPAADEGHPDLRGGAHKLESPRDGALASTSIHPLTPAASWPQ